MKKSKILIFLLIVTFAMTLITFADSIKFGSRGQEVKNIQTQLKELGFFKANITGYFGIVTKEAVKKFQEKNALVVDGKVGPATIKAMQKNGTSTIVKTPSRGDIDRTPAQTVKATDIAKSDTKEYGELLDWWTEADKFFYRGAVAKVTDVKTGRSFNVKRTYGRNHADSEALTKEDAEIMKEIWGGNWNWSRRAVIVEIDGRKIAASSNGMPHAGLDSEPANVTVSGRSGGFGKGVNLDTVKDNGMNGHFCIHFLNSRTHGSNKVDVAHQKTVRQAAGK